MFVRVLMNVFVISAYVLVCVCVCVCLNACPCECVSVCERSKVKPIIKHDGKPILFWNMAVVS